METNELRQKSKKELQEELQALLREHLNLRIQKGVGSFAKNHLFKMVRKNIARVKTVLHEKAERS